MIKETERIEPRKEQKVDTIAKKHVKICAKKA